MFNNTQTYSDIWQHCLDRIKEQTSAEEFTKWFQPIVPLAFDGTTLRLRVPNASFVYQIEKNYIPFLRPIISQLYGQQTQLRYAVPRAETATRTNVDTDSTAISRFAAQNDTRLCRCSGARSLTTAELFAVPLRRRIALLSIAFALQSFTWPPPRQGPRREAMISARGCWP